MLTLTEHVKFIESIFGSGLLSRNSRNFDVRCPICNPKDKSKRKLSILLPEHRLHCWTCGYKAYNLVPLIKKFGTREQLNAYRQFIPTDDRNRNETWVVEETPAELTLPKDFQLFATYAGYDPDVLACKRYMLSRDISDDDLWYYKLGFSNELKWHRRIIVPSFDKNGKLNHYVARAIDKFKKPKYETPTGERSSVIFNEINIDWTKRVILCEGTFDMMKCGENAIPILGSDLNESTLLFNTIVMNNTPIMLALDADMKLTKTPRIAKKLLEYDIDLLIVDVKTDPGDMSKRQFRQACEEAHPFEWGQNFLDRLNRAVRVAL